MLALAERGFDHIAERLVVARRQVPPEERPRDLLSAMLEMRDAAGAVVGIVGLTRDITQAKRSDHHRELLDVALGKSELTPEEAVIRHLRMHYDNPERYSSYAVKPAGKKG